MSSTDKPRDFEKDLSLCAEAATLNMQSHNPVGRLVRFASEAVTGWPHAIQRAKAAEAELKKLRDEKAAHDDTHRNKPFD